MHNYLHTQINYCVHEMLADWYMHCNVLVGCVLPAVYPPSRQFSQLIEPCKCSGVLIDAFAIHVIDAAS